jgi:hypothetical protein
MSGAAEIPAYVRRMDEQDEGSERRGIRPLMHEPNRLWPWVFRQHQVWVDINGSEHEIESMPFDYVENVVGFCLQRATWIYVLVAVENEERDGAEPEWGCDAGNRAPLVNAAAWLEATPLMRALRRRLSFQPGP